MVQRSSGLMKTATRDVAYTWVWLLSCHAKHGFRGGRFQAGASFDANHRTLEICRRGASLRQQSDLELAAAWALSCLAESMCSRSELRLQTVRSAWDDEHLAAKSATSRHSAVFGAESVNTMCHAGGAKKMIPGTERRLARAKVQRESKREDGTGADAAHRFAKPLTNCSFLYNTKPPTRRKVLETHRKKRSSTMAGNYKHAIHFTIQWSYQWRPISFSSNPNSSHSLHTGQRLKSLLHPHLSLFPPIPFWYIVFPPHAMQKFEIFFRRDPSSSMQDRSSGV